MSTKKQLGIALALLSGVATSQAVTVFSDNFTAGSTLNAAVPAAPTANSTDYAILATKSTSSSAMTTGNYKLAMGSTTTGIIETQAKFANSPVTLGAAGDYIQLAITFNNTLNLLTLGANSYLTIGLFDSNGSGTVTNGALAASGLSGTAGSPYATGYAANWEGYQARIQASNTVQSRIMSRPIQSGAGTASRNQDVVFPGESSGYNNPSGTQIGTSSSFNNWLTQGNTYTYALRLELNGSGFLDISESLYAGVGTAGPSLFTVIGTSTGSTTPTLDFDALGFGWKHSVATGTASAMDISLVEVTTSVVPEPSSASLLAAGLGVCLLCLRHRKG